MSIIFIPDPNITELLKLTQLTQSSLGKKQNVEIATSCLTFAPRFCCGTGSTIKTRETGSFAPGDTLSRILEKDVTGKDAF